MLKKYTYVTCIANKKYVEGASMIKESLKCTESEFSLLVLIPKCCDNELELELIRHSLEYQKVDFDPPIQKSEYERAGLLNRYYSFIKLEATRLTNFDKIILLDTDIFVNKNIDHLFAYPNLTSCISGKAKHPEWIDPCPGVIVIKPSVDLYNSLIKEACDIIKQRKDKKIDWLIGDFDVFASHDNYYWRLNVNLHLPEVYQCLDYDIDYVLDTINGGLDCLFIVHYASNPKIWLRNRKAHFVFILKLICKRHFKELRVMMKYIRMLKMLRRRVKV